MGQEDRWYERGTPRWFYHSDRLAQMWGTCAKGTGIGFRLRARVGDIIECGRASKWIERHQTPKKFQDCLFFR